MGESRYILASESKDDKINESMKEVSSRGFFVTY